MSSKAGRKSRRSKPGAPNEARIELHAFGRTDVGCVREHNEDAFIVADLSPEPGSQRGASLLGHVGPRGVLLAVCDGMGGAAAGEVASRLAVEVIEEGLRTGPPPDTREGMAAHIVTSIEVAASRISSQATLDRAQRGMGTTATVAVVHESDLLIGQVGDSRAYVLRGGRLVQVTRDQTLAQQLIQSGQLTEEESWSFPHNNVILQALGTAEAIDVVVSLVELRDGDTLMLCSDGLSGMLRPHEVEEILRAEKEPEAACRALVERAESAGGHDNITVIVATLRGLGTPTSDEIEGLDYRSYSEAPPATSGAAQETPSPAPEAELEEPTRPATPEVARDPRGDETAPPWLIAAMLGGGLMCFVATGYFLASGG